MTTKSDFPGTKWVLNEFGEFPATYSDTACRMIRDKYFAKGETSWFEVVKRVVDTIANEGYIAGYFADKGEYPFDLQSLVEEKYLKKIPRDPITRSADTWVVTHSDVGDEEDISNEQGIEDVHSGADEISLDGLPYADF